MKIGDLKFLIPFIPLILTAIILIIKPYYLFSVWGDTDFHLARARGILENPLLGIFWDFMTYYPNGRPVWHPPLFHVIYGLLWALGGVRFAHSFMCVFQVLLTVGVASWVANKEYGIIAGFFAGFLSLCSPVPATLIVAIPATYLPIFAVLTIYYIPKDKKKAFIIALLGLWTHMVALAVIIPLFLADNYKNKMNLKIIASLLLSSGLFLVLYWIYFSNRLYTGGILYSLKHLYVSSPLSFTGTYNIFLVFLVGTMGLYFLYKINKKQFNLIVTYIALVIPFSFFGFGGDFLRGFQFAVLVMAILSGLFIQKGYDYISRNYKKMFLFVYLGMFFAISILGYSLFIDELPEQKYGWEALDMHFEEEYAPLKSFIEHNTKKEDIIWTEPLITEKLAWMTGRKVSNGLYPNGKYGSTIGFVDTHQNINIYRSNGTFVIKDPENKTLHLI